MNIDEILECNGFPFECSVKPTGAYVPVRLQNDCLYTSGHTAVVKSERLYLGKLGVDLSVEEGIASAKFACLNCLHSIRRRFGTLNVVEKIIKVTGYINCSETFYDQTKVLDGASNILLELFGEAGYHARSAVGVSSLPFNSSVEIELIVQIKADGLESL